jgi:sugar lactone lactonase YvrE
LYIFIANLFGASMKNNAIKSVLVSAALLATQQLNAQYISTIIGNGVPASAYTGDGGLAVNAGLNGPSSVTFDGAGNLYIADMNHNVVRKVNTLGVISTIAGTGVAGYSGNDSAAINARLNHPTGVAVDLAGNIFIADNGNNVIRKVSTSGVITTYAGTGVAGYSGDLGLAIAARLTSPQGVAIDGSGRLYIADAGNNVVRAISDTGTIYTVAGTGVPGNSGNGGVATVATLHYPTSVAVDVIGNIYIADFYNNVVKKVNTDGIISVVAGSGAVGISGDGGAATMASMYYPSAISIDGARSIYIADQGNNVVRKVDSAGTISRLPVPTLVAIAVMADSL